MKATILFICFFVFFICTSVSNAKSLQFRQKDGRYEQRYLNVGRWNLGLWSGAWFRSLQIEASKPNIHGDYLWGSVYVGTAFYPVSWVGYYTADINRNLNQSIANNTDLSSIDVSTTSSFIVSSYLRIEERNTDDIPVVTLGLKNMLWTYSPQRSDELTDPTLGIYAFVVQGRHPKLDTIEIQYIATQQGGFLNMSGDVLVIPKAIESIIIINNWKYLNPNNSLSLRTAVGTSTTTWNIDGSIQAGSGSGHVFFHLASEAFCDGKFQKTILTRETNLDAEIVFDNPAVEKQLKARYGKETSVELIWVTFPPGAEYIEYDPLMGAGDSPFDPQSPADNNNNTGIIIGVSVIVGFLIVGVIVALVYREKRRHTAYMRV